MLRSAALVALSCAAAACSSEATNEVTPVDQTTAASSGEDVERPDFEVIQSSAAPAGFDGAVELRRYEQVIVAETTVTAPNRDAASEQGFRTLAAFIFGKNRPSADIAITTPVTTKPGGGETIAMTSPVTTTPQAGDEIAMTAPVTTSPGSGEQSYTVRFTMPGRYTMETLPHPVDPAVTIRQLPARQLVALRFTGQPTDERVAAAGQAITSFVQANALTPSGPLAVAGYDGPDVPKARQHWEVHQSVG